MTETGMENLVKKWLKKKKYRVESQVRILGKHRLDLVAYDKRSGVFTVVECKSTSEKSTVNRAFDQLVRYRNAISRQPDEFVDRVSSKMQMRFGRWMQATDCGRRVQVEFVAALRDGACNDIQCIRDQKARQSSIGIMRCKNNGKCKLSIKSEDGKRDAHLCKSEVKIFRLKNNCPRSRREHPPIMTSRRS